MEEEKENQENQETIIDAPGKIPKYSIVLRFWSSAQEIEVDELISCQHKITKNFFYKFIDVTGRLWENVPESDAIIINNLPTKEDIDDFMRIKKELKNLENQPIINNAIIRDVSIG